VALARIWNSRLIDDGSTVFYMTDAQHDEAPTTRLGAPFLRRKLYVVLLLAVGVLAAIGGLIGGLDAKAFADHALLVASSLRTLPVLGQDGYLFPGAHSIVPDYTGLWIGIIVAVLGVIVLLAGVAVASTLPTFLKVWARRR